MEHLLALKVMRLSRPSLAAHAQPYFADSNALSAHAQASPLSLERASPLPGGPPSTLRDLALSPVLLLPEAFGSISLGETFTSSLCVNNESALEIIGSHLLVEIQTASNKVLLGEIGGIESRLQPGEMLQLVVSHEIKELGQHVLACTVSYHVPPALRNSTVPPEDPANPTLRTIRKFYKFMVSNPLSVRTKVHVPRSPTALLSPVERHKVFLEVHVQNLTAKPLHFERIQFECADGWKLDSPPAGTDKLSLLHPQDLRQYMYILLPTPEATPSFPITYPAGTIIALGRLDMSWRSSFGEPGRLLTSMLSRKIPLPPAPPTASAIPPHLQRQTTTTPRPNSPAPYIKNRASAPVPNRPQSPAPGRPMSPSVGSFSGVGVGVVGPPQVPTGREVEVDLVVREIPGSVYLDRPFKVKCALGVMAVLPVPPPAPTPTPATDAQLVDISSDPPPPPPDPPKPKRARLIRLAIQHTHNTPPQPVVPPVPMAPEVSSPRALLSALSSPGGAATPRAGAGPSISTINATAQGQTQVPIIDLGSILQGEPPTSEKSFPSPYSSTAPSESPAFLGSSLHILPPILLSTPAVYPEIGSYAAIARAKQAQGPIKGEAWVEFELGFVCLGGRRDGGAGRMKRVGGVRVLVVEDREVDVEGGVEGDGEGSGGGVKGGSVVREWDVIGEVWVERGVEGGLA
ncbi:hypothetical protein FRC09_000209 [Ceratobasidium sp. 395]|nr:hypothetical protein FRC09_000209 [Ceratobasidium sp. 395]